MQTALQPRVLEIPMLLAPAVLMVFITIITGVTVVTMSTVNVPLLQIASDVFLGTMV